MHMTPEVASRARALARAGSTMPQASRELGVPYPTLWLWARRKGVVFRTAAGTGLTRQRPGKAGDFVPTVMTPEVDARARAYAAQGYSQAQTARELGVSDRTLHEWAKRKGVTFTRAVGPGRHGLTGEAAETYRLARKKRFSAAEALRIAGAAP